MKEAREDADGNTEALRKAMVYYRSLFDELLVVDDGTDRRNCGHRGGRRWRATAVTHTSSLPAGRSSGASVGGSGLRR